MGFASRVWGAVLLTASSLVLSAASAVAASDTTVYLPDHYSRDARYPLVILLHGSGATGDMQDLHLAISERVSKKGMILAVPEAQTAGNGMTSNTMLLNLINEMESTYAVDSDRVYLIGHSMGGYQSLRFACDYGDRIAGMLISSAAGSCSGNPPPVKMIVATGDQDIRASTINSMLSSWKRANGCSATASTENLDLEWEVAGAETTATRWDDCSSGKPIVSWRAHFGRHVPMLKAAFADRALAFLLNDDAYIPDENLESCVPELNDSSRFTSSSVEEVNGKTVLQINEYSDAGCNQQISKTIFAGPAGQHPDNADVYPLALSNVSVTAYDQSVVDALNAAGSQGYCGNQWDVGTAFTVDGASSRGRQACFASVGGATGAATLVKRLSLTYLFTPPLP